VRASALITGGTGFIGSRLALEAGRRGWAVAVLGLANTPAESRNIGLLREAGIEVVLESLAEMGKLRRLLGGRAVVYHLAAAQHETNVPDEHFWELNLRCTERLLDACVEARVGRFVYASTMGVYGSRTGVLDEATPPSPDNIYGVTKLAAEQAVLARCADIPVAIARIAEAYGPGDRRLLKLFRGLKRGYFPIIGDGRNRHPLIYSDDLVDGLLLLGEHPAALGETFVLAGDEQPTTDELVRIVAAVLGREVPRIKLPLAPFVLAAALSEGVLRPVGVKPPLYRRRLDFFRRSLELSNTKAAQALGFRPSTRLAEGVSRTAAWYRAGGEL
jgi:dihydroflavonol-4-reductase